MLQVFEDAYKSPLSLVIVDDVERLLGKFDCQMMCNWGVWDIGYLVYESALLDVWVQARFMEW